MLLAFPSFLDEKLHLFLQYIKVSNADKQLNVIKS